MDPLPMVSACGSTESTSTVDGKDAVQVPPEAPGGAESTSTADLKEALEGPEAPGSAESTSIADRNEAAQVPPEAPGGAESNSTANRSEGVRGPPEATGSTESTATVDRHEAVQGPAAAQEAAGSERCKVGTAIASSLGAPKRERSLSSGKGDLLKAGTQFRNRTVLKRHLIAGKFATSPPSSSDIEPVLPYLSEDMLQLHTARYQSQASHRLF